MDSNDVVNNQYERKFNAYFYIMYVNINNDLLIHNNHSTVPPVIKLF